MRSRLGAALQPRHKWGVAALVAVLHVAGVVLLVKALGVALPPAEAPRDRYVAAYDVRLDPTYAPPDPQEGSKAAASDAGAPARGATLKPISPTPVEAPRPVVVVPRGSVPPGATVAGSGAGAAGEGAGPGGGGVSGTGGGTGGTRKPVKIAGDIRSVRDYPADGREARLGTSVVIVLAVGVNGRAGSCTIRKPSGNPDADAITCRLAIERFRFRPALDERGEPVAALYGWEQRWFSP